MRIDRLRGLYAVTPDESDTTRLCAMVGAAIDGGAAAVQYRNKSAASALRSDQARALASVCRQRGALFIVNDDPTLARDVDADGVHVGEDDAAIAQARECVEDGRIVGVSCYDDLSARDCRRTRRRRLRRVRQLLPVARQAAMRDVPTSPLVVAAKSLGVPVVAIGGITSQNAPMLVDAGIDAVAVISRRVRA